MLVQLLAVVLSLLVTSAVGLHAQLRVIYDTDLGNDIDDAQALAMLHAFESRGEVKLLAVTITKDNRYAAPYVDLVNHFYGRPHIPIGMVRNGPSPSDADMLMVPVERRHPDGSFVYARRIQDGRQAPDALEVLRQTLAAQEDGSVVLIQVGFSTNLARLLDTPGDRYSPLSGRELVRRKVRLLSYMGGRFPVQDREIADYNIRVDPEAARKLFAEWPTPIVASGSEVGETILFPASSIKNHYGYVEHHPIADAYRHFRFRRNIWPYDRPTWDLTSVPYAVRPEEGYFDLSEPGRVGFDEIHRTEFTPSPERKVRYLIVNDQQRLRILEAFIYLSSQPPERNVH